MTNLKDVIPNEFADIPMNHADGNLPVQYVLQYGADAESSPFQSSFMQQIGEGGQVFQATQIGQPIQLMSTGSGPLSSQIRFMPASSVAQDAVGGGSGTVHYT